VFRLEENTPYSSIICQKRGYAPNRLRREKRRVELVPTFREKCVFTGREEDSRYKMLISKRHKERRDGRARKRGCEGIREDG